MMSEVAVSPPPSVVTPDNLLQLFIVGGLGVGKSSLVQRFVEGKFLQQYAPTSSRQCIVREARLAYASYDLHILDFPGMRSGQLPFPAESLTETSVVVMVFDITSEESFELLENFFVRLLAGCSHGSVEPIFLLVASKRDMERVVSKQAIKRWCTAKRRMGFELMYAETSAQIGFGVTETFVRAATMAAKRHRQLQLGRSSRSPSSRLPCIVTQPPQRVHPSIVSAPGRGYISLNRRMSRLQSMARGSGDVSCDEEERTLVKVIIAGTAGVGKTSIIERFSMAALEAMEERTEENEFCHVDVAINGVSMTLQLWDISDDPRCYKDAHALVMVFDLTNRGSFAALDGYWKFFTRYASVREGSHFPCVVVGNKSDLVSKRHVSNDQIKTFCRKQSAQEVLPYVEVSAEQDSNLDELFKMLSQAAYSSFAIGELPDDIFLPVHSAFRPSEGPRQSVADCRPCGGIASFWQTLFGNEPSSPTGEDSAPRRRSF